MVNKPSTNSNSNFSYAPDGSRERLVLDKYLKILQKYNTPQGLIRHTLGVYRVASLLAERVASQNFRINKNLLLGAALLHDIDKIHVRPGIDLHGVQAVKILEKEGIDKKVINLVKNHPAEKILEADFFKLPLEDKILFYADKRFAQKICSLKERVSGWRKRYPANESHYSKLLGKMEILEKELLKMANLNNEELDCLLNRINIK